MQQEDLGQPRDIVDPAFRHGLLRGHGAFSRQTLCFAGADESARRGDPPIGRICMGADVRRDERNCRLCIGHSGEPDGYPEHVRPYVVRFSSITKAHSSRLLMGVGGLRRAFPGMYHSGWRGPKTHPQFFAGQFCIPVCVAVYRKQCLPCRSGCS